MKPDPMTLRPELRAALITQAEATGQSADELLEAAAKFYALLPPDAPPGSIPGVDPADVWAGAAEAEAGKLTDHDELFARLRARK
jgi:hypothetical protein